MLRNKAHKLLRVAKQQYCSSIITNSELNEIYLFTYLLQILKFVHLILRKKHMKQQVDKIMDGAPILRRGVHRTSLRAVGGFVSFY